jgi:hypothetical protein
MRAQRGADGVDAFFEMLSSDLKLLAEEAKRSEGFGSQIVSMFHHSDGPSVHDLCVKAMGTLRGLEAMGPTKRNMESVRLEPVGASNSITH